MVKLLFINKLSFMGLILESKRDNLLLPYYEILTSKGMEISFGRFKSILLEHLTQNGNLRNLSLASNYYLAGAARYYFNGDLTYNKDLALYYTFITNAERRDNTNNGIETAENHKDEFIEDVCERLNVLIKILRDSYIDSIGTNFELPEDFGTLPIKKLFSKYNQKIKKELGVSSQEKNDEDTIDRNENVGNGYKFEILYTYNNATKYNKYTLPMAWCITYGEGHFNSYMNGNSSTNGKPIHYVIFRKNGFERVERKADKSKWIYGEYKFPKPQDEYGNSLIAVLQNNNSWTPNCITSRWNHGAGDFGDTEADHAYTTQEFMRITGVNEADLQRIYLIWKNTVGNIEQEKSKTELNREKRETLLKIKEAQMRINGGENPLNFFALHDFIIENKENIKKSVFVASLKNDQDNLFIVDKGNVVFDSIFNNNEQLETEKIYDSSYYYDNPLIKNVIFFNFGNYKMIYDLRQHKVIDIGGVKKFKSLPQIAGKDFNPMFYEVKLSGKDIALVDTSTNIPLKLPNGQFWFNEIHAKSKYYTYYSHGNKIYSFFIGDNSQCLLEIIFDSSSGEKYFYNLNLRRFIDIPSYDGGEENLPVYHSQRLIPIVGDVALGKNYYAIRYCSGGESRWERYCTPYRVFKSTGEPISIGDISYFGSVFYLGNGYFALSKYEREKKADIYYSYYDPTEKYIYNVELKKIYTINGKNIKCNDFGFSGDEYASRGEDDSRCVFMKVNLNGMYSSDFCFLFDKQVGKFVENPYGYPEKSLFKRFGYGNNDGSKMSFYMSGNVIDYDNWNRSLFRISLPEGIHYKFEEDAFYGNGENEGRYDVGKINYLSQ